MATYQELIGKTGRWLLLAGKNIAVNSWRRLRLLGHRLLLWRQKQQLAARYRRFGQEIFQHLEAGEANPLLLEDVKDLISQLKALNEKLAQRLEAADQIRQAIKATSYRLPAPEPAPAAPAAETPAAPPAEEAAPRPD